MTGPQMPPGGFLLTSEEQRIAARAVAALVNAYQARDEDQIVEILTVSNIGLVAGLLLSFVAELGARDQELFNRLLAACEAQR